MLQSGLTAADYLSPAVFAAEQERLYRRLWIFAGFAQLLSAPNAFLTRQIGGVPVVVQNLGGTLRAFENLCAHRQMALQWEPYGERPLVCRYHGWAYDPNGFVRGVPNAALYAFEDGERQRLRLREFALRRIGNLLFVNLSDSPPGLEAQFREEFLEELSSASARFDGEVIHSAFSCAWNWKLNFENVLDGNHVQFVHPQTFFPALNDAGNAVEPSLAETSIDLRAQLERSEAIDLRDLSFAVRSPAKLRSPWYRKLVERFGEADDYYNWFIFPNVNFCSVHGQMFLLQQFMPESPSSTEFHLSVVTAMRKDPEADFTALLRELMRREKLVIDEDAVALAALQRGLHAGAPPARHGVYEAHIVRMLRWYARAMREASA